MGSVSITWYWPGVKVVNEYAPLVPVVTWLRSVLPRRSVMMAPARDCSPGSSVQFWFKSSNTTPWIEPTLGVAVGVIVGVGVLVGVWVGVGVLSLIHI